MTDEEIAAFAENLLNPQLNAGLESAQQEYETAKLAKEQEIANLAQSLEKSIEGQNRSYRQSTANTEAAALARGMGRSSYTLQNLANQGDALAKAVEGLTAENQRLSGQIQEQITQAAEQNAQTQGRLKTDYAAQLAAKIQELRDTQRREWNQNYLTAISGAMGEKTTGTTTGTTDTTSRTDTSSTSTTTSGGGGSGGSGGSKEHAGQREREGEESGQRGRTRAGGQAGVLPAEVKEKEHDRGRKAQKAAGGRKAGARPEAPAARVGGGARQDGGAHGAKRGHAGNDAEGQL